MSDLDALLDALAAHSQTVEEQAKRVAEARSHIFDVLRDAPEEVIAWAYWRADVVGAGELADFFGMKDRELRELAAKYPEWNWRCGAGHVHPVTSRTQYKDLTNRPDKVSCRTCMSKRYARWSEESKVRREAEQLRLSELQRMPYREYLRTPEWEDTRRAALKRAKFRCQVCYANKPLDVHHRTYERRGNEWSSDVIALCRKCHATFHGKLA